MRYFIQHVAGAGDLILDALPRLAAGLEVRYRDDSAMMFDSTSAMNLIGNIPFASNAFVVITSVPGRDLDAVIRQISRRLAHLSLPDLLAKPSSFRTVIQIDGRLTGVSRDNKVRLDLAIASRTGARHQPRGLCQEYWVIGRAAMRDVLFCARLHRSKSRPAAAGSLSAELAAVLVSASCPDPRDVFLDPFGGCGSLVLARLELPVRRILYSDTDLDSCRRYFPRELMKDGRVRFLSENALTLPSVPDRGVDAIVTDPPWGEYRKIGQPYGAFAHGIARTFDRVLHPVRGRFVVLTSRRTAADMGARLAEASFRLNRDCEILVNGHPATVLVGGRPAASSRAHTGGPDAGARGAAGPATVAT